MEKMSFSTKEINQMKTLEKLKNKELTQEAVSKILKLSTRQIRNKMKRYKNKGPSGLIHRSRGRPSHRKWCEAERKHAIKLLKDDLDGFGPTFASEKLEELYAIKISKETLRKTMIKEGLWIQKKAKIRHRKRRERKTYFGEMIQLDGSFHPWFGERSTRCTLLVFIDDATSKIVWLEFAKSESTYSVLKATKNYIEAYGRPLSFYVDFGSVFSVNLNNPERDKLSQFERAMKECDIEIKHASSPQAKGRVERANKTLQDRLVKELKLAGIASIAEANKFVQNVYLPKHNDKFTLKPACKADFHRSLEGTYLDKIFCIKEKRILQNDFVVAYKKRFFQLHKQQPTIVRPKERITICEQLDSKISLHIRNNKLAFTEIKLRFPKIRKQKLSRTTYWKPPVDHPWRQFSFGKNRLT